MAKPGSIRLIGDCTLLEQLLESQRQCQHPCDPWDSPDLDRRNGWLRMQPSPPVATAGEMDFGLYLNSGCHAASPRCACSSNVRIPLGWKVATIVPASPL